MANIVQGNALKSSIGSIGDSSCASCCNNRIVKIAVTVGVVALVMAAVAALLFIPGSPLAFAGSVLLGTTLCKIGCSAGLAIGIYSSTFVLLPAAIVYLNTRNCWKEEIHPDAVEYGNVFGVEKEIEPELPAGPHNVAFEAAMTDPKTKFRMHLLIAAIFKDHLDLIQDDSFVARLFLIRFRDNTTTRFTFEKDLMQKAIEIVGNEAFNKDKFLKKLMYPLNAFVSDVFMTPAYTLNDQKAKFNQIYPDLGNHFHFIYYLASNIGAVDDILDNFHTIFPALLRILPPDYLAKFQFISNYLSAPNINDIPAELVQEVDGLIAALNNKSFKRLFVDMQNNNPLSKGKILNYYQGHGSLGGIELTEDERFVKNNDLGEKVLFDPAEFDAAIETLKQKLTECWAKLNPG